MTSMDRGTALRLVSTAKYVTLDSSGTVLLFASLRQIESSYGINYSTISKSLSIAAPGVCSHRDGWLIVRRLSA